MVCIKPHDPSVRKCLYYLVSTMAVIGYVSLVIVFIVYMADSKWEDECDYVYYRDYDDCVDSARAGMIAGFCVMLIL